MRDPKDFLERLIFHHESLPDLRPTKWGWWEPLANAWHVANPTSFIPDDRGGAADDVFWQRTQNPKATGSLSVAWKSAVPEALNTHSQESIELDLADFNAEQLIGYIQNSIRLFDGDIAFIHTVAASERPARELSSLYEGGGIETLRLRMSTHTLRHWLAELPWATVFGSAYVRMFGLEKLLTAPVHLVKKLSDEAVYLQLSPKLCDLIENYEVVDKVREAVKDHLGRDAFFDRAKAYPLRGPVTESGSFTLEEYFNFKRPPPIGTVFRVPDFQLIEDEFMKRA